MSSDLYRVLRLPPRQFRQAYPLIEAAGIGFSLDRWLAYANALHKQRDEASGILSVQNDSNYIHALAAYELRPCGATGRVIHVDHLCVLDLLRRSAGPVLMATLEQRARTESCSEVRVRVPDDQGVLTWIRRQRPGAMLLDLGYTIEGTALSKSLF